MFCQAGFCHFAVLPFYVFCFLIINSSQSILSQRHPAGQSEWHPGPASSRLPGQTRLDNLLRNANQNQPNIENISEYQQVRWIEIFYIFGVEF
jgi:hypothetical protein